MLSSEYLALKILLQNIEAKIEFGFASILIDQGVNMTLKWYNVNEDARVWSGHADTQKQGWMRAGSAVLAVEEYQGSVRFEDYREPSDLKELTGGYPEYWMRLEDLSLLPLEEEDDDPLPVPVPVPSNVDDAALGAAFRLLVNFILGR